MKRQASLIAKWMQFGFIHGVMNTDNMSISGETIDFGPCAFLDEYDPKKRFSFIDRDGRYAFGNQPSIAHWNLARLAEALLPLMSDETETAIQIAEETLESFPAVFKNAHLECMTKKIGIPSGKESDEPIVNALLDLLRTEKVDYTLSFRHLRSAADGSDGSFLNLFSDTAAAAAWINRWRSHLVSEGIDTKTAGETMRKANPVFIPRNHRIEEVIEAGRRGDFEPFRRLHEILQRPFDEKAADEAYELPPGPHEIVQATFCGT
jgi:uncharacterized protein YdiU (UPF0061 family)